MVKSCDLYTPMIVIIFLFMAHPEYQYNEIQDGHPQKLTTHHQLRDEDVVKGSYSLVEHNGAKKNVQYTTVDHKGFNAAVENSSNQAAYVTLTDPKYECNYKVQHGHIGDQKFDPYVASRTVPYTADIHRGFSAAVENNGNAHFTPVHPEYEYNYGAQDGHFVDQKVEPEVSDSDVVKGSFSPVQLNGTRTVHYTANDHRFLKSVENSHKAHITPVYPKYEYNYEQEPSQDHQTQHGVNDGNVEESSHYLKEPDDTPITIHNSAGLNKVFYTAVEKSEHSLNAKPAGISYNVLLVTDTQNNAQNSFNN